MIYIRIFLIVTWMMVSCALGLVMCTYRWGDYNLDRDFARIFSWGVLKITGFRVRLEGAEHLKTHQPCIFIGNHQSGLDMATFGSFYPERTIVIGKKELKWIPLFGLFFVAAGNVCIDRSRHVKALAGISQAVDTIVKKSLSVWIFPEGTRNRTGEGMLPFKKGAFHMAQEAGIPIVPVVSAPLKTLVSWKERKMKAGEIVVRILPPISVSKEDNLNELALKTRELMLQAFHD